MIQSLLIAIPLAVLSLIILQLSCRSPPFELAAIRMYRYFVIRTVRQKSPAVHAKEILQSGKPQSAPGHLYKFEPEAAS
jgi:hypothetical protein